MIFVCKGSAGEFFEDDEDELNDVEVNNFDLNQSLRSNSWNRSRKSKTRREEVIFLIAILFPIFVNPQAVGI